MTLFRARTRLVQQRTELINMLSAVLYELGHVVPQGAHQIGRIEEIVTAPNSDLPVLVCTECREVLEQVAALAARIAASNSRTKALAGVARSSPWR